MPRVRMTYGNVTSTLAVVLAAGGGTFAIAQGGGGGTGAISACVKKAGKNKGAVRIANRCRRTERRVTWNRQGQPGAAGSAGTPGTPGAPGAPGTDGATGPPGAPNPDAADSQLLDGLDSTAFLRSDAEADGALTGNFPSPLIAPDAITGANVDDDSLGGDDLDESTLIDVNAATTDGVSLQRIHFVGSQSVNQTQTINIGSIGFVFTCNGAGDDDLTITLQPFANNVSIAARDNDETFVDSDWDIADDGFTPKNLETGMGLDENQLIEIVFNDQGNGATSVQFVNFNQVGGLGFNGVNSCLVAGTAIRAPTP